MRRTDQFLFFWGKHEWPSNFYPARFTVNGVVFEHTEMAFMYAKARLFGDIEVAKEILQTPDPQKCKNLGRTVRGFDQTIWDTKARSLMFSVNREKYLQNPGLLRLFVESAPLRLVEASPFDKLWGIGLRENSPGVEDPKNWRGANYLGDDLTRLRDHLLVEKADLVSRILSTDGITEPAQSSGRRSRPQ